MRPLFLTATAALILGADASAQSRHRIVFDSAAFRTDTAAALPNGLAVLELETRDQRGKFIQLELDRGVPARFRDDGQGFDLRPFDGIFTGVVRAELSREIRTSDELMDALRRGRRIPQFDDREFLGWEDSRRLRPLVRPNTKPVIAVSAMPPTVDIDRSLMITDTAIIDHPDLTYNFCTDTGDPNGPLTFNHVMTELAGSTDVQDFVMDWIDQFEVTQNINNWDVEPRPWVKDQILAAWPTDTDGNLIMEQAPWRTLAVVNRIDLNSGMGYGQGGAGEARIVFCLVDENCEAQKLLLIFEYAINQSGCGIKEWGEQWAALSDLDINSQAYRDALIAITSQFTDVTSSPNFNGLAQLRTNELLLPPNEAHWELREFVLDGGALVQNTVALTPDLSLNGTATLADAILDDDLDSVLGGSSVNPFGHFWEPMLGLTNDERHEFSLNTCNGCHMREADMLNDPATFFTHVSEANFGSSPPLSGFLEGITVADPVSGELRDFGDLERRRQELQDLIDTSCFGLILGVPAVRSH